jgi:uncharacterized membrane protein SpoIIM required for sporulation
MALELKSRRFRSERETDWKKLEALLDRYEKGRARSLSDDEIIAIPVLYRSALSSLSVARAISLDKSLVDYLESLCTRAYFCVYGTRTTAAERISQFFSVDWPETVRDLWRETVVAALLSAAGAVTAFLLTLKSPDWFNAFVSPTMALGRGPEASTKELAASLGGAPDGTSGLSVFSTFLFTHNAQIAIFAFALGFAACLPTAFLLVANGFMLGAFFAVFAMHGLGLAFGGWALVHGVTELFAITLAGAGGFRIGWSLAFPGKRERVEALRIAGREAATIMVGVLIMLAVAGLIEGFLRQLVTSTLWRYVIAVSTGLLWGLYFYLPRKGFPLPSSGGRRWVGGHSATREQDARS